MSEVAVGYVSLVPKFGSGFKSAIAGEIGQAGVAGGTTAGNSFKSTFLGVLAGNVMTSAIRGIGSTIKGAFGGGFDRLMNIEQAEIKLRTLGINVDAAMASVGDAVDGTKFAISDAADMAAFLGASGVAAGEDMTKWLSRTADAAQFTNRPFGEMQQLIGEVVASGKITGETLNRLPLAAAALADKLGVSQAEVRKLASEGKISAEEFGAAMDAKIGGAAKNAGASFLSLRDNVKTALNATMAALIEPFTKAAMPIMTAGLSLVKGFRDSVAKPLGSALGEFLQPKAEALAASMEKIPAFFAGIKSIFAEGDFTGGFGLEEDSPLVGGLFRIRTILVEVTGGIRAFGAAWTAFDGDVTSSGFPGFMERLAFVARTVFTEITGGVRAFVAAWQAADGDVTSSGFPGFMERLANTVRTVFSGAKDAVLGFVEGFGGIDSIVTTFSQILPLITGPLELLKTALLEVFSSGGMGIDFGELGRTIGSSLKPILELVGQLASALTGALAGVLAQLIPVALEIGGQFLTLAGDLAGQLLPVLMQLISLALPIITNLISGLAPVVLQVVSALAPLVMQLVSQLLPVFMQLLSAVIPPLMSIIDTLATAIISLAASLMPLITTLVNLLAPILVMIVEAIAPLLGVLLEVVNLILALVVPAITAFVSILSSVLTPIISALTPLIQTVFGFIASTIANVMGVVQGVIRVVTGLIKGDWEQVWSGIKQIFGSVWNQIKNLASTAVNLVKGIFTAGFNLTKATITGILNGIVSFVTGIPNKLFSALGGLLQLAGKAAEWFGGFVRSATTKFGEAVEFVRGIPGKILSALGNVGSKLTNSGKSLISGFVTGIKNGFTNAVSAVKNGIQKIRDFFPFSPAKVGPFSGSGYTSHSGRKLMQDFAAGIEDEQAVANRALEAALTVSPSLDGVQVGATASGSASSVLGGTTVAGPLVHIAQMIVRSEDDIRKLSQELQRLIDAKLRALGKSTAGGIA